MYIPSYGEDFVIVKAFETRKGEWWVRDVATIPEVLFREYKNYVGTVDSDFTFYIPLGNLKTKFSFRHEKTIHLLVNFPLLLFDIGVCLPFNKRNEVNLKKSQVKLQNKSNLSVDKFYAIFLKKRTKKSSRPILESSKRLLTLNNDNYHF